MVPQVKVQHWCVAVLVAALLITTVLAGPEPFFQGSRYGKRTEVRSRMDNRPDDVFGGPRFHGVQARSPDHYFVGSRYGKRSEFPVVDEPYLESATLASSPESSGLNCVFTGIGQLYQCRVTVTEPN